MSTTIYSAISPVISKDKNKFNFVYQITNFLKITISIIPAMFYKLNDFDNFNKYNIIQKHL